MMMMQCWKSKLTQLPRTSLDLLIWTWTMTGTLCTALTHHATWTGQLVPKFSLVFNRYSSDTEHAQMTCKDDLTSLTCSREHSYSKSPVVDAKRSVWPRPACSPVCSSLPDLATLCTPSHTHLHCSRPALAISEGCVTKTTTLAVSVSDPQHGSEATVRQQRCTQYLSCTRDVSSLGTPLKGCLVEQQVCDTDTSCASEASATTGKLRRATQLMASSRCSNCCSRGHRSAWL